VHQVVKLTVDAEFSSQPLNELAYADVLLLIFHFIKIKITQL